MRLLLLAVLLLGCGKTTPIKITASANKTVSLSGIGTLSSKLEIRQAGDKALAVVLFTWAGSDSASVTTSVALYRFDTNKLEELERFDTNFDLEPDGSKSVSTDTTSETRRRCAVMTMTATGFNSNGDEKTISGTAQTCEKE